MQGEISRLYYEYYRFAFDHFLVQQRHTWGCLTFRPPPRQQELRNLKIGISCAVKKPSNIAPNQVIHPLPSYRDEAKYHDYLFKDVDKLWYIDMTPESYKTGKTYGHQKLLIPNQVFPDSKCFYDY